VKILCLGDSPYIKTGFGVVNRVAVETLLEAGHELIVLGGQDPEQREPLSERMTFVPTIENAGDLLGWTQVPAVVEKYQPDAVNIVGDAAMVTVWLLHDVVRHKPTVAYMPVEGAPLNPLWQRAFTEAENLRIITCSKFGQELLADNLIYARLAYHGVSSDFAPISPEAREDWRQRAQWSDKFVVMCVAQNVGRKQWPRLFEGIKLASKRVKNVVLYAHTVPFNNHWLGGHHLPLLAQQIGVADRVMFPRGHTQHNAAIGLSAESSTQPGLVDLYGMADAFILPSQVEGFGLPLAEAMACGLPVATTDYAAQAEVVGKAGLLLPVSDWEWDKSHAQYANVAPGDIAEAIVKMANPEVRRVMSRKSLDRAQTFRWTDYQNDLREMFA
jgi:glycosyltransferase involved in cell wall biosynthesis